VHIPIAPAKTVRAIGAFFLNLLLALVLIDVLVSPFVHFDLQSIQSSIVKQDSLNAVAACGLGYYVYRRWRRVSTQWVWAAGFCWFTHGALLLWFEQRSMGVLYRSNTVYWQHFGTGCSSGLFESCRDWIDYTLPLLRTVFYSVGAWCCWLIEKPVSSMIPGAGFRADDSIADTEASSRAASPVEKPLA
jgi:hypothetical protein